MDHDKARDDNAENLPPAHQIRNEETSETEQDALFQYRANNERFVSDEESDESFNDGRSEKTSSDDELINIDHTSLRATKNTRCSEHSDFIADFYEGSEKFSYLPDNNMQKENIDIYRQIPQLKIMGELITKISEILLNGESSLSSDQSDSEKPSRKSILAKSPASSKKYYDLEEKSSEYHLRNLKSASDLGTYCMIPSPHILLSRYINSLHGLSTQPHPNSNALHRNETRVYESNPISTSLHQSSPSTSFEAPLEIIARNLSRTLEYPETLSQTLNSQQESQRSNNFPISTSVSNVTDEHNYAKSNFPMERLFRSWEVPSIHGTSGREEPCHNASNECTSSSSKIRKETASSSDLPSTSEICPQDTSPRFPQYSHVFKSACKLESDTSSDNSEDKFLTLAGTTVRKLGKKNKMRKKRKASDLSQSSENCSTFPKTSDRNFSGNAHPLFRNPDKKSSKPKKRDFRSVVSSETMNFKIFETHTSSRKRLISGNKTSDSD